MHIAIAGNIGSGKTTLTKMLAAHYGWTPKFESVDFNPYLADFYADMERWSFNLQIYFLNKRFKDVVEISRCSDIIIQDRTIYEDARIFAPNLHGMGLMSTRDFENYSDLFDLMMSLVSKPDLLIYLRSSIPNLVAQIQKRGREYESSIRIDYLTLENRVIKAYELCLTAKEELFGTVLMEYDEALPGGFLPKGVGLYSLVGSFTAGKSLSLDFC